jgi:hypothetical protein
MRQKPNKTRAKDNPFVQGTFDVAKDTLPPETFTLGGMVYPKWQCKEVWECWFGNQPLPPSKWQGTP